MQRVLSTLALAVLPLLLTACPPKDHVRLYHTEPIAPSLSIEQVESLSVLGSTRIDDGVNFSVFSGNATRMDLLLFDDPEATVPTRQFEMVRHGDAWNLFVEGIGLGQHYGFLAWGPNWEVHPDWELGRIEGFVADVDSLGNRFDPNKLLFDPYTRAFHRDHDWSKGSTASGPARTQSTVAAASKSVIVESEYVWSENETTWRESRRDRAMPGHRWEDMILYEVHAKGFTADPASGVDHPGTYRGFGEKADYLADLGITAVELMPVMEKPLDGGYWGYNTLGFFAPELSYASDKRPGKVMDEFKWMVDELHQRGIEVILDVVYNHTGEGGLWREKLELADAHELDASTAAELANLDPKEVAGLYSYRGLDNASYYALSDQDAGFYNNNTGVGNTTRCNYRPMEQLILDSLRFWVEEMHVDGFRFDLAVILGEKDRDYTRWDTVENTMLMKILQDPVIVENNVRIISEPWAISGFYLGQFPKAPSGDQAWYEWNGHFRDVWRSFVNNDGWAMNSREGAVDFGGTMTGSYDLFGDDGRGPHHSINFVTVHDGFTLYDLFTYDNKQNGCSPLNPDCCDARLSAWCDPASGEDNNRSRDWGSNNEPFKRQQMRNLFAAMLLAQGTPLILGGDEWMRTQLGNNNAYYTRADNPNSWYQWGTYQAQNERRRMHDFVRQLIALRKEHAWAFARSDYAAPPTWLDAGGGTNPNWGGRHIALRYNHPAGGPGLLVLVNMELGPVDFQLPAGNWTRLVDTQLWFDDQPYFEQSGADPTRSANAFPEPVGTATYGVQSRSIVVLVSS
ncbi:MAG: alpha-amylase family glycosyl hydrolase [Deltaproteobacteria bacterium]|nr:alpha-amylase family glycosyl hydrolase [Deltaproteobacteria bacterium]